MRSIFLWLCLLSGTVFAQKGGIRGKITDEVTGEGLIGAAVSAGGSKVVATNLDGNFELNLEDGEYTIKFSYLGYEPLEQKVTIKGRFLELSSPLKTKVLR